jgi:phage major head subunit gpT-like protein
MAVAVTRDYVRAFNPVLKAVFQDAYQPQRNVASKLATFIESNLPQEDYAWISALPTMRQFVDERIVNQLKEYGFTIKNLKWEATVGIQREVLEDEQHNVVKARLMQLAEAAQAHYDQILFVLINGNGVAYDGTAFYHANHGNLVSGGASALSATSLAAAITAMKKQKLDNGEPLEVNPTHLLVPPDLEYTARTILNSAFYPSDIGAGKPGAFAQNVLQGSLELVVSPRLTTATEWHVFDCSHYVRPFIVQQRIPITLEWLDDEHESDATFMRDEYLWGVRSRDNVGFGLYQYAYKSVGA